MRSLRSSPARMTLVGLYLAVFLVMLLFTALTPMAADDYSYCFSWVDNARMRSILQIFPSMAVHRQLTNGRVVAHFLVQLVLLAPKVLFNILNACAAVLLLRLFERYFPGRSPWQQVLLTALGALLLFNQMPSFGQVALWLDGSINYSWGILFFLLYLLPYASLWLGEQEDAGPLKRLGFLLLALLVGAYSENGSLATLFAAFCLTLLAVLREKKLRPLPLAGLVLGLVGYVFLMTAPATGSRSAGFSVTAIARNFKYIAGVAKTDLLPLFLLFAAALALCFLFGADRRRIVLAAVLFLAGLGSLASFVMARYFVPRHFCFTVYFTALACLILLAALLEKGRPILPSLVAAVMAVFFAFNFSQGALDIGVVYLHARQREAMIHEALAAGETSLQVPLHESATRYSAVQGLDDLDTQDGRAWPNCSVADYYGLDSILGVPPEEAP